MQVTYSNVKPFLEGVKQMGRVVLLGIIPIVLFGINTETGVISINWAKVLTNALSLALTAVLMGIDKDRHLTGKLEGDKTKTKGLTGY